MPDTNNSIEVKSENKHLMLDPNLSMIDLEGLTEEQIQELKYKAAAGTVEIHQEAAKMKLGVQTLDAALTSANKQIYEATSNRTSLTLEFEQKSDIGKTNVVVGNTERAEKGQKDHTLIMVIAVVVVAILALLLRR